MLPFPPLLLIVILAKGEFDKYDDYDDHDDDSKDDSDHDDDDSDDDKVKVNIITIARDETRVQTNKIFA